MPAWHDLKQKETLAYNKAYYVIMHQGLRRACIEKELIETLR